MKKKILIADNSRMVKKLIEKQILNALDVDILSVTSKAEALNIIDNDNLIHIAIIDYDLEDAKNGELAKYCIEKDIPTIVLSSSITPSVKEFLLKNDILDFLLKDKLDNIKNVVNLIDRTLKNYDTNILVVDDSLMQLKNAQKLLNSIKLNVTTATNGQEALDLINKGDKKYSLVLTDYNMPIMDGKELIFNLREKYKKNELAIIVFTANNEKSASEFLKIGANDFIQKPYTKIELKTRINSTLELIDFFDEIQRQKKKLKEYNITLEEKVKVEVEKNIQKELQLMEQSKLAAMGAMIANIAHQWRQPLTQISSISSGVIVQQELKLLNDDLLKQSMEDIISKTQYLSEVIQTFRKFLMENKETKEVILQDRINIALNIVKVVLDDKNIKLINNIDYENPIKITLVVGELSEVIINIINNACDALVERNVDDPHVILDLIKTNDKVTITIEDNAGGIPEDIIDKIFDEYFTTKPKDKGTGLGLHMSKKIINDSLKGNLYVKNTNLGAKFFIELLL